MKVYVECFNDTHMFKQIKQRKKDLEIDHAGNKPKVIRKLRENKSGLGIVDRDNENINGQLQQAVLDKQNHGISVYKYFDATIIEFEIDLENWLYSVAKKNKINPRDYNLPSINSYSTILKNMYRKKGYSLLISALLPSKEFQFLLSYLSFS